MRGIAIALGLPPGWFEQHLTGDPTVLFRIFHYPALPDNASPTSGASASTPTTDC